MMIGGGDSVTDNCLTKNGEYGFSAFQAPQSGTGPLANGPLNMTLSRNEISFNNTCNFEAVSPNPVPSASRPSNCSGGGEGNGCGCSGAGKFWEVQNATVDGNYLHDNYSVGLWADTNNDGFTIDGNYIADNYAEGLIYETSYNALTENNTFVGNAVGSGRPTPGSRNQRSTSPSPAVTAGCLTQRASKRSASPATSSPTTGRA